LNSTFNVTINILIGHFGDDFTGQMTQPTVSQHGQWLVNHVKGQSH